MEVQNASKQQSEVKDSTKEIQTQEEDCSEWGQSRTAAASTAAAATDPTSISSSSTVDVSSQIATLITPFLLDATKQIEHLTKSQAALQNQLDSLLALLRQIEANSSLISLAELHTSRLVNLKRRLTLVYTIIQNANERCLKLIDLHNKRQKEKGT